MINEPKIAGKEAAQADNEAGIMHFFVEARSRMQAAADAGRARDEKFWLGYMMVAHEIEGRK